MSRRAEIEELVLQHVAQEYKFEIVEIESLDEVGPEDPDFSKSETRFMAKVLLSFPEETKEALLASSDPVEAEAVANFLSEPMKLLVIVDERGVVRSEFPEIDFD